MIKLTRLNGDPLTLNAILIEQVQSLPDTTITLTTGKKMVVKETEEVVMKRTIDFYCKIGMATMLKGSGEQYE